METLNKSVTRTPKNMQNKAQREIKWLSQSYRGNKITFAKPKRMGDLDRKRRGGRKSGTGRSESVGSGKSHDTNCGVIKSKGGSGKPANRFGGGRGCPERPNIASGW